MKNSEKFLKYYRNINLVLSLIFILMIIILCPTTSSPFINGLFTTLGSSLPILIIIYFFHYRPIKHEARAMIPRLQKVIDFNNQNARKEKERLIKFFGTDNISIFTSKYVIDKPLGMSYWEMFLGFDKRIRGYESKAFYYTLDLTYKRHYNFNKYVYEIFHKKFFGTNEHERYSSKN